MRKLLFAALVLAPILGLSGYALARQLDAADAPSRVAIAADFTGSRRSHSSANTATAGSDNTMSPLRGRAQSSALSQRSAQGVSTSEPSVGGSS